LMASPSSHAHDDGTSPKGPAGPVKGKERRRPPSPLAGFASTRVAGSDWGGTLPRAPAAIDTSDRTGTPAETSRSRIVANPVAAAERSRQVGGVEPARS